MSSDQRRRVRPDTADRWLGKSGSGDKALPQAALDAVVGATKDLASKKDKATALVGSIRQMLTRIGARNIAAQTDDRIPLGDYNALTDSAAFVAVQLDADRGLTAEFSGREGVARRDGARLFASTGPALDRLFCSLTCTTAPVDLSDRFDPPRADQASDTQLLALVCPVQVFAAFPRVYPRRMGEAPRAVHVVCGCVPEPGLSPVDSELFVGDAGQDDAFAWRMAAVWHLALKAMRATGCKVCVLVDEAPAGRAALSARALAYVLRTHFVDAFRLVVLCPTGAGGFEAAGEALVTDDLATAIPVRIGVLRNQDPLALAAELSVARVEPTGSTMRAGVFVPTNWRALRLGTIGMGWNHAQRPGPDELAALGTSLLLAHRDLGPRWWVSRPTAVQSPFASIDLRRPLPFHPIGRVGRCLPDDVASAPAAAPAPAPVATRRGAVKRTRKESAGTPRPRPPKKGGKGKQPQPP